MGVPANRSRSRAGGGALALLAAAMAASAALALALSARLTFFGDEWEVLLGRRGGGLDSFLEPHNEHLALIPVAVYKGLLEAFGLGSLVPFQLASTLMVLAVGGLVFANARSRVGDWAALAVAALVLFCGAAWEVLIWPWAGLVWAGSTAAGLGMLMALQRSSRAGDAIACGLLAASLAFSSLGLAWAVGAAVAIWLAGGRRLARAYVVAVPMALFALWYATHAGEAGSSLTAANVLSAPLFVAEGLAATVGAATGLFALREPLQGLEEPIRWLASAGVIAVVVVLALAVRSARVSIPGRPSREFWVLASVWISFWLGAAANETAGRTASSPRFLLSSVVLALLATTEWFRGVPVGRGRRAAALAAVVGLAIAGNLVALADGFRTLERESELARAQLGALELARGQVSPGYALHPIVGAREQLVGVSAGPYLDAVDSFGSPADSPDQLARRSERIRQSADRVLAGALGVGLSGSASAVAGQPGSCRTVSLGEPRTVELRGPGLTIRAGPGSPVDVSARNLATEFALGLGTVSPGTELSLVAPRPTSGRPWEVLLAPTGGRGELVACGSFGPSRPAPAG